MKEHIKRADDAVAFAQQVRAYHRRETPRGNPRREADIQIALDRIKEAMTPLRSLIARFPYLPQTTIASDGRKEIRAASLRLQRERRKLFKMKSKPR